MEAWWLQNLLNMLAASWIHNHRIFTLVRVTQLGGVAMTAGERGAVLQARQDADRDYQV